MSTDIRRKGVVNESSLRRDPTPTLVVMVPAFAATTSRVKCAPGAASCNGRSRSRPAGIGTNSVTAVYLQRTEGQEASMKIAKIVLAGCTALTVLGSVALAQQATTGTGTVTTIDRIRGTIAIRQTQSGTVGANTGGVAEQFKLQGGSLETLHAGDSVKYSATEAGGVKTITTIERQ
jgi:hypothetical protein